MGVAIEKLVLDQLKKGQGETNTRLDALIALQKEANAILNAIERAE